MGLDMRIVVQITVTKQRPLSTMHLYFNVSDLLHLPTLPCGVATLFYFGKFSREAEKKSNK